VAGPAGEPLAFVVEPRRALPVVHRDPPDIGISGMGTKNSLRVTAVEGPRASCRCDDKMELLVTDCRQRWRLFSLSPFFTGRGSGWGPLADGTACGEAPSPDRVKNAVDLSPRAGRGEERACRHMPSPERQRNDRGQPHSTPRQLAARAALSAPLAGHAGTSG